MKLDKVPKKLDFKDYFAQRTTSFVKNLVLIADVLN